MERNKPDGGEMGGFGAVSGVGECKGSLHMLGKSLQMAEVNTLIKT